MNINNFADYAVEPYERYIIKKFIKDGDTVFDVGANVGAYSVRILNSSTNVNLHCFEPSPHVTKTLAGRLGEFKKSNNIVINQIGLSNQSEYDIPFLCLMTSNYCDNMGSTFNPEWFEPGRLDSYDPQWIKVNVMKLDDYAALHDVDFINFLKVDVEGHQMAVFQGAAQYLAGKAIKLIQWETTSKDVRKEKEYLESFGYKTAMLSINPLKVKPIDEGVAFYNYLAWTGDEIGLKYN